MVTSGCLCVLWLRVVVGSYLVGMMILHVRAMSQVEIVRLCQIHHDLKKKEGGLGLLKTRWLGLVA